MKKLALPLLLLSGFAQAQSISFNEVSVEYIKGDQDPAEQPVGNGTYAADVSHEQQQLEGAQLEVKAEIGSLFYVVGGYEDSTTDFDYLGYESEITTQDISLGFGVRTPLSQDVPDTTVYLEARANQLAYEFEDNNDSKVDEDKTAQTLRVGVIMAPFEMLEIRPALSRLSGADELSSTAFELGFLVRPMNEFGFSANFVEKVDLDQRRYEVGVVYKF